MTDFLTQYTEATERCTVARQRAEDAQHFRRLALWAMHRDGMAVLEISRLVKLPPGTIGIMLAKCRRDLAEVDAEADEIQSEAG